MFKTYSPPSAVIQQLLSNRARIKNKTLTTLMKAYQQGQYNALDFSEIFEMLGATNAVISILQSFKTNNLEIKSLTLGESDFPDENMELLAPTLRTIPELLQLNLGFNDTFSDRLTQTGLNHVRFGLEKTPNLKSLNLDHVECGHRLTDTPGLTELTSLLKILPNLKELSLFNTGLTKEDADVLSSLINPLKNLKELDIGGNTGMNLFLQKLNSTLPLIKLAVRGDNEISLTDVLTKMSQLKTLDFYGRSVSEYYAPPNILTSFPNLTSLSLIRNHDFITDHTTQEKISIYFKNLFSLLPNLKYFETSHWGTGNIIMVNQNGLINSLQYAPRLQELDFHGLKFSTPETLKNLIHYIKTELNDIYEVTLDEYYTNSNELISLTKALKDNIKEIRARLICSGRVMKHVFKRFNNNESGLMKKVGEFLYYDDPKFIKDFEGGIKMQSQLFLKQYEMATIAARKASEKPENHALVLAESNNNKGRRLK